MLALPELELSRTIFGSSRPLATQDLNLGLKVNCGICGRSKPNSKILYKRFNTLFLPKIFRPPNSVRKISIWIAVHDSKVTSNYFATLSTLLHDFWTLIPFPYF